MLSQFERWAEQSPNLVHYLSSQNICRSHSPLYLAQAALTVVCYLDNPTTKATPEDAVYMCSAISDMRNRLLPEYIKYTGYALGIIIGGVPASVITSSAPKGEKQMIIEAAKFLKIEAEARRTTPAMMAFMTYAPSLYLPALREHKAYVLVFLPLFNLGN